MGNMAAEVCRVRKERKGGMMVEMVTIILWITIIHGPQRMTPDDFGSWGLLAAVNAPPSP